MSNPLTVLSGAEAALNAKTRSAGLFGEGATFFEFFFAQKWSAAF
jgi:hypothetical protein